MLKTRVGSYVVTWLCNPAIVRSINWKDINNPCQETVYFEPDGDGRSKYVYAHRVSDNKLMKVAKAVRVYVFLPILFGTSQFLLLVDLFYRYDAVISLYCMYGILFLLFTHYILNVGRDVEKISSD